MLIAKQAAPDRRVGRCFARACVQLLHELTSRVCALYNNNMTTTTETVAQIAELINETAADAILNLVPAATAHAGTVFGRPSLDIRVAGGEQVAWMTAASIHVMVADRADYLAAVLGSQVKAIEVDGTGYDTIRLHTASRTVAATRKAYGEIGACGYEHAVNGSCSADKC